MNLIVIERKGNVKVAQTQFGMIKHLHSFPMVERVKYQKEINLVSWYGKEPKYDNRGWSEEQGCRKPGRGISLSEEEFRELISIGEDLLY